MRSVFVGFETLNPENLRRHDKRQNLGRDYDEAIRRCHDLGVMVNGSFVFGLDDDGPDVFERTVEWGISRSLETSTYHIMTPYPGTALHRRIADDDRIVTDDWDLYDTRHVVFKPRRMTRSSSKPATGARTATSTRGPRSGRAPRGRTR
jgi:radical SAM superfamily enzyme YgiQ (UPF0313 family)